MIYWVDVKNKLLPLCPPEANDWSLKQIVTYLNKEGRLSLSSIAKMTDGLCGRTSLFMKMKEGED